mgnify:CR=1 FL=1
MRFLPSASVNKNCKEMHEKRNDEQILTIGLFLQLCMSQLRAKKIVKQRSNKKLDLMAN